MGEMKMGASRESFDIWQCLLSRYPSGRWMGRRLFKKRFWKNSYLWHDSFGKYFNRVIGCKLWGHRHVANIADPDESKKLHCFNCDRGVKY
jgi:hypothetical protein